MEGISCPKCASKDLMFNKKKQQYVCEDCNHCFKLDTKFKSLRIFLSYGHDKYSVVAEKLKADLEERGHEVWFDLERLTPGGDWTDYIEEGLEWVSEFSDKGAVVLLMTPHSVRRPDGYCLNEISRAIQRGLKVIPIMLFFTEPPLPICRIQWLDMQDCIPLDKKIKNYEKRFERLLEALEHDKIDFEGFQSSVYHLLEPIPFDADILQHINRFTGRKWLFKRIDEWLSTTDSSRILMITGNPGSGKTAIASWLCENCKHIEAFHLCRQGHCDKSDPRKAVTSIAYQLSTQFPEYQERLKSLNLRRLIAESNAKTLFDSLIVQPLSANFPEPENTVVVLIDALDEATRDGKNELASFIASEFSLTPNWLRLIITTRREAEVMTPLQGLNPYVIDIELNENLNDIKTYLLNELKNLRPNLRDTEVNSVSNFVLTRSEGNFLYAAIICQELENGRLSIDRLEEFPVGLGGVYWEFFERRFSQRLGYYEEKIRPALEIIAASQEPLTLQLIASILGWNEYDLRFTKFLGSFFPTQKMEGMSYEDSQIRPFHQTLIDWLTNIEKADVYFVSVNEGHKILADYGWQEYLTNPSTMSRYALNHLAVHLIKTERWKDLTAILTDLKFIEAKCKASMLYNLIRDYDRASNKLPEAQFEKELNFKREEKIKTYSNQIIAFAEGEILSVPTLQSIELQSRKKIERHQKDGTGRSSPLNNLLTFFQFVNSESHGLAKFGSFPGYCLQQAFNSAKEGPVANTAENILKDRRNEILFLKPSSLRNLYNPHSALIKTLEGHKTSVRSVSMSYDGKRAVSGSRDTTARFWDLETGECLKTLRGHSAPLYGVSMTPDGRLAVSGSRDNTLRVWDLETGECLRILKGHKERIFGAKITPNGKKAISASRDNTLRVWDLETGECLKSLKGHHDWVLSVSITPDGRLAVSGSRDNTLRLWDPETGECLKILKGHAKHIWCVDITPDGSTAVSGSEDNTIRLWGLETGECLKILRGHTGRVFGIQITSDGRLTVSGSGDNTLRLWDLETGECLKTLEGHTGWITGVSITPDGRKATSASRDASLRLWDLESGESFKTHKEHTERIFSVNATRDGLKAVSGSGDKTLRLWDISTGKSSKTLKGHIESVYSVSMTPDGKKAVSGSRDTTLRVWDLETGECLRILEGHSEWVTSVCFTPDGKKAVSGSWDKTLRLWDLDSGNTVAIYQSQGLITAISNIGTNYQFVYGNSSGDVTILKLVNLN